MKAPVQTEMPFVKPSAKALNGLAGAYWEENVLPPLRAAIERLTVKECEELFAAKRSHISDAVSEREDTEGRRKRIAGEWIVAILISTPHATRLEILTALCDLAGYMPPERKRQLNADEKLERYRAAAAKRLSAAELARMEQEIEES